MESKLNSDIKMFRELVQTVRSYPDNDWLVALLRKQVLVREELAFELRAARLSATHPGLQKAETSEAFQEYLDFDEGDEIKVFAVAIDGAYAWYLRRWRWAARTAAVEKCLELTDSRRCHVLAVGNKIYPYQWTEPHTALIGVRSHLTDLKRVFADAVATSKLKRTTSRYVA